MRSGGHARRSATCHGGQCPPHEAGIENKANHHVPDRKKTGVRPQRRHSAGRGWHRDHRGPQGQTPVAAPEGLKVTCPDQQHVVIQGIDKQLVGQFAAEVRARRKPEPYKGKGIRYLGEPVRRKQGKAMVK